MLGPVSAWMGDRLRAGAKLSRYVTSHPGQLSLAIPLWVGAMSTSLGWEPNCRSGIALAMCHRHSGLSTYGLNGLWKGDEHPAYAPLEYGSPLPLYTSMALKHVYTRAWRQLECPCPLDARKSLDAAAMLTYKQLYQTRVITPQN